jgi:hypothetical protein
MSSRSATAPGIEPTRSRGTRDSIPGLEEDKRNLVPPVEVEAVRKRLGLTKLAFAEAAGVSQSLISEWTGKGHKQLVTRDRWESVLPRILAYAADQPTPDRRRVGRKARHRSH